MIVKNDDYQNEKLVIKKFSSEIDVGLIFADFKDCSIIFTIDQNILIMTN